MKFFGFLAISVLIGVLCGFMYGFKGHTAFGDNFRSWRYHIWLRNTSPTPFFAMLLLMRTLLLLCIAGSLWGLYTRIENYHPDGLELFISFLAFGITYKVIQYL